MSMRHLVTLSLICTAALATAAMRGGCAPTPCPNLHIACPDLDCPDGFQVDKSGCAICACVGEQPADECFSDADCPDGFVCELPLAEPMTDDVRCLGGDEGERCGDPLAGQCVERNDDRCEGLDEWACIERPDCEPTYVYGACDCIDCFCAEDSFAGCVERRDPVECRSDADCPGGFCEFLDACAGLDCEGGGSMCVFPNCDDGSEPLCDMAEPHCGPGQVVAVRNNCYECVDARSCQPSDECFSDADCAAGEFCATLGMDCLEGDLDCGMVPGVCLPLPDRCEDLDERSCIDTAGCLPVYESLPCVGCDCAPGEDCLCGDDTTVCDEPVFAGCTEEIVGCFGAWLDQSGTCRAPNDGVYPDECCGQPACTRDADCGEGGACFDGLCVPAPSCPDRDDPTVHYINDPDDVEMCFVIDFICADGQVGFSDACGCGCIDVLEPVSND